MLNGQKTTGLARSAASKIQLFRHGFDRHPPIFGRAGIGNI